MKQMPKMSLTQDSLKRKLEQLECHFTWELKQEDVDLPNLLNRLEEQTELDLGGLQGVARTYNFLGYVKFLLGVKTEALNHLSRSEALIRESFEDHCDKLLIVTYGNFAWCNYHLENYTECESYLKKLQNINENFPAQSVPEVLGEKGWTFLKFSRKYYEKAKEVFKKAVAMDPEHSEWNAGYAIALYRTETQLCAVDSPAVRQLRQAIDINPDDDVLRAHLGLKLLFCSKHLMNESEKLMEAALNGSPDHPHVVRYVGMFFRNCSSVDRSIELLEKALKSSPGSAFIYHQLARCYRTKKINLQKEKRHIAEVNKARDQSIYYLEMATALKASFIVAMSDLALQYGESGDLLKAQELFETSFKTATDISDHVQAVHYDFAQFQQYAIRNETEAVHHYTECLEMDPNTVEGTKSAYKLKKIAHRRLDIDPNDWEANEILALIYRLRPDVLQDSESNAKASHNEDDEYLNNLDEIMTL